MEKLLGANPDAEWISFLNFHTQRIEVKANDFIIQEGEEMTGLHTIHEGKVKVVQLDGEESRLIRLAGNGDLLGHRGLGGNWKYPISAVALVPTTLDFLPLSAFQVVSKINATFVCNLLMFMAEELRSTEEKRLQQPVIQRVAKSIKMNYDAFGFEPGTNKLSYTITRRDISSHAGTTYESVIRTLADLSKRDVIDLQGKAIVINDLVELERFAAGEYNLSL